MPRRTLFGERKMFASPTNQSYGWIAWYYSVSRRYTIRNTLSTGFICILLYVSSREHFWPQKIIVCQRRNPGHWSKVLFVARIVCLCGSHWIGKTDIAMPSNCLAGIGINRKSSIGNDCLDMAAWLKGTIHTSFIFICSSRLLVHHFNSVNEFFWLCLLRTTSFYTAILNKQHLIYSKRHSPAIKYWIRDAGVKLIQ